MGVALHAPLTRGLKQLIPTKVLPVDAGGCTPCPVDKGTETKKLSDFFKSRFFGRLLFFIKLRREKT
jgi:hypothetical protein